MKAILFFFFSIVVSASAFHQPLPGCPSSTSLAPISRQTTFRRSLIVLHAKKSKFTDERRKQLGIVDEDEYDLGVALEANTDPLISKIIAGSLIVVLVGLLVAGVVIPSLTDYGEGVCNPILTQGRC